GALSLWEFGEVREPGKPKIRLFNPTVEANGWTLEHTVIEIVNDDMPFLVDSVSAELNRLERTIHLLLHPVVQSTSYMHIEIDQETQPAELERIRGSIAVVLDEVRVAVADFKALRQQLAKQVASLQDAKLPMPDEEVSEAREFLKWLDGGNFIFLGFRRYGFETRDGQDYLPAIPDSGLGILRSLRTESAQRSAAPMTREFSEYARRKDLLIITKANSRSRVHRPVPMDRIGIKLYDDKGNLIGEDRFLGLFTSAAYS